MGRKVKQEAAAAEKTKFDALPEAEKNKIIEAEETRKAAEHKMQVEKAQARRKEQRAENLQRQLNTQLFRMLKISEYDTAKELIAAGADRNTIHVKKLLQQTTDSKLKRMMEE